jgi:hypothetical protein
MVSFHMELELRVANTYMTTTNNSPFFPALPRLNVRSARLPPEKPQDALRRRSQFLDAGGDYPSMWNGAVIIVRRYRAMARCLSRRLKLKN